MRKFICWKICALMLVSAICAFYLWEKNKYVEFADLTLSNIEALASGENNAQACFGKGSLYCEGGYYKYKMFSLE